MYLSKLILNRSRRAMLWSAWPYRVHQRLCMACGNDPRLLFRIEATPDATVILAQTYHEPNWETAFGEFPVLAGEPLVKAVDWPLREGQVLSFRLRANPTKRLCHGHDKDDRPRDNVRVPLYTEEQQRAWLERKGERAGFRPLRVDVRRDARIVETVERRDSRNNGTSRHITLASAQFDGLLAVTDPARLRAALEAGIGSAKGFGFGLLSLGPPR
jgi:CRISPR system Cascade subunit CasE